MRRQHRYRWREAGIALECRHRCVDSAPTVMTLGLVIMPIPPVSHRHAHQGNHPQDQSPTVDSFYTATNRPLTRLSVVYFCSGAHSREWH
jgi:hypothetical protein